MLLNKRVTIKDIAMRADVSIGTVHCSLTGKPGVGEETRQKVMAIAKEMGYRPNSMAASLKRKTVRIVAALPGPDNDNRFYFTYVWEGVRDCLAAMHEYNIEVRELPFYNDAEGLQEELGRIAGEDGIDGLLTLGYADRGCKTALRRIHKRGIPMVLVGSDVPQSGRLCCVQPNYDIIGRTMAELISWQAPAGDILLCAGNLLTPSHFQIVLGFEAYLKEKGLSRRLVRVHDDGRLDDVYGAVMDGLRRNGDVSVCCCVNARGSVMLGRALEDSGRAGSIPAIGCDVFEENLDFLERGTFCNLIHKDPYSQAYMATKALVEHLLKGEVLSQEIVYVGSEMLFRSHLPLFRSGKRSFNALLA